MTPITAGFVGSVLLLVLLFLGMPLAFVMMFVGFLGISYLASVHAALPVVAKTVYETAAYYPYTIIPLFILMGAFVGGAGITAKLDGFFDKWCLGGLGLVRSWPLIAVSASTVTVVGCTSRRPPATKSKRRCDESGWPPDSEWVARGLEGLGHEVIVADPNFAPMYATRTRRIKTDRRDARALADANLLGAYRPAHRLSDAQRQVRGRLCVREALVRTRTRYIALIRALLRQHGYRVPSGGAESFIARVAAMPLPGQLRSLIAPLLAVMLPLNRQLAYSDKVIDHLAAHDPRVKRLRTVPSIGPVTAAAFLAADQLVDAKHCGTPLKAEGLTPEAPLDSVPTSPASWAAPPS